MRADKRKASAESKEKLETENRNGLSHYQGLQARFEELATQLRNKANSDRDVLSTLSSMEVDIQGVGDYLSQRLPTKCYNEVTHANSAVAKRAFGIFEILELILSNLSVSDLVKMERVSKSIRSVIEASSVLQAKTGSQTDNKDSHVTSYSTLFDDPDLQFDAFQAKVRDGGVNITFTKFKDEEMPRFGPRWMKMLACQPAVKHARVCKRCIRCCSTLDKNVIVLPSGLTLQNLDDRAEAMFEMRGISCRCYTMPFPSNSSTREGQTVEYRLGRYDIPVGKPLQWWGQR